MANDQYKYHRGDFGELPVDLLHLDINLNFLPEGVDAVNCLRMRAKQRLDSVTLDARELEIISIDSAASIEEPEAPALGYEYRPEDAKLAVNLAEAVEPGAEFTIRTRTRCRPTETMLEGIYKDVTPPGAPQQYMSQCQQWGFQRIMPIFDDCRAKCTMTTTLEADAAYTHLITNGNIDRKKNPGGRPVPKPGDPSRQVITYHNPVPMAPYLFIAAAGTWDEVADEVVYPGGRKVRLEYLVPPGRAGGAAIPMEILKQSVLWVGRTQGYQYTGDTYRTICMTRSNFGGMENVGNTTVVTEAALIDEEHTIDATLYYAHAVIVHEFEHNQCGSETTMATPFDIWLNEAYTVDVERRFLAEVFDPAFVRLRQVDSIRDPLLGPLAMEDGGQVGRIVRDAFNDPDELIDGVTYVKAAEVIGMLRLYLGQDAFWAGRRLYFERYKHKNADSDQFFACFEEASGRPLEEFKRQWLFTIGYPQVSASTGYDPETGVCTISLEQKCPHGAGPFPLPVSLALVDEKGRDIPGSARVHNLEGARGEVVIEGLGKAPAFASLNRGYSFYGSFTQKDAGPEIWRKQALLDPDQFNRVEAMRAYTDRQRVGLLHDAGAKVDPAWVELYGELLADRGIPAGLAAYLLRIDEQPLDRRYLAWFPEQVAARDRLLAEVNRALGDEVVERFLGLDTYARGGSPNEGIEERLLKAVLLGVITSRDDAQSHQLLLDHFRAATTAADRVSALALANRVSAGWRMQLLEEAYKAWRSDLNGYANYLRAVSGGTRPDVFQQMEREKNRGGFDITQPSWCRALFLPMAMNTRMIWTEEGLAWAADRIIELATVNVTTASRLLNLFQLGGMLRPPLAKWARRALGRVAEQVADETSPVLHRQAEAYLKAMEQADKG